MNISMNQTQMLVDAVVEMSAELKKIRKELEKSRKALQTLGGK